MVPYGPSILDRSASTMSEITHILHRLLNQQEAAHRRIAVLEDNVRTLISAGTELAGVVATLAKETRARVVALELENHSGPVQ